MKHYLKILSVPLLFLILYALLDVTWHIFDFPTPEAMVQITKGWFELYGLPILLLSSFIEGMLLVGGYFPGVFVIFLGVIIAGTPEGAALAVAIATLGLMIAHIGNYLLGRYGWYKLLTKFGLKASQEKAKEKLEKRGPLAIFLTYWLPSFAALTDTAAGIIQLPFRIFIIYSLISSVFWNALAGIIVYAMGQEALVFVGGETASLIFYSIIAIWMIIILILDFRRKNNSVEYEHET